MRESKFSQVSRIVLGILVIFGSILLASRCEEEREINRHARYERCLKTGLKPLVCSFEATFNPGAYE